MHWRSPYLISAGCIGVLLTIGITRKAVQMGDSSSRNLGIASSLATLRVKGGGSPGQPHEVCGLGRTRS